MSKFSDWNLAKLEKQFQLTQCDTMPALTHWLDNQVVASDFERKSLKSYQETVRYNILHWNEAELSMHFIGPLLQLIKFEGQEFNLFAQRSLSGKVSGTELSGRPDGIIAHGRREPEVPYFCLQEYKPEKDPEGDPVAQCLAAMLVAQELNQHQYPVYGCYVLGRNWFFMTLKERDYAISRAYDVTQDDIFEAFALLKGLRIMIEQWVNKMAQ
ncbi:hypothetical protein QUF63_03060 [Anaerolineales bacterium HSG25]|nr:hypothetical protein [Anaerolineales bacterium HSG25]